MPLPDPPSFEVLAERAESAYFALPFCEHFRMTVEQTNVALVFRTHVNAEVTGTLRDGRWEALRLGGYTLSNRDLMFGTGNGPDYLPFVAPFFGVIEGSEDSAFDGSRSFLRELLETLERPLETSHVALEVVEGEEMYRWDRWLGSKRTLFGEREDEMQIVYAEDLTPREWRTSSEIPVRKEYGGMRFRIRDLEVDLSLDATGRPSAERLDVRIAGGFWSARVRREIRYTRVGGGVG